MKQARPISPARKAKAATKRRAEPVAERKRGGPARPIADLMPHIGGTAFRRFGFVQSSVVTRWPEIAGPQYAHVCLPESIRFPQGTKSGGTLQLTVKSGHATLIQHVIPEIIERVNRFFGYSAVSKVRIRQGMLSQHSAPVIPPRPAMRHPARSPITPETGGFSDTGALREIADPELRAVLESLAQSIASKAETQS